MSDKSRRRRPPSRLFPHQFLVKFDEDDRRLLEQSAEIEKLNRSEILRRALREYHKKLKQLAIAS